MWVICPNYGFSSTFYFDLGIAYTDVILSQKGYATLHYITQNTIASNIGYTVSRWDSCKLEISGQQ